MILTKLRKITTSSTSTLGRLPVVTEDNKIDSILQNVVKHSGKSDNVLALEQYTLAQYRCCEKNIFQASK